MQSVQMELHSFNKLDKWHVFQVLIKRSPRCRVAPNYSYQRQIKRYTIKYIIITLAHPHTCPLSFPPAVAVPRLLVQSAARKLGAAA